eukprot:1706747-Amphidinium_carterae.1
MPPSSKVITVKGRDLPELLQSYGKTVSVVKTSASLSKFVQVRVLAYKESQNANFPFVDNMRFLTAAGESLWTENPKRQIPPNISYSPKIQLHTAYIVGATTAICHERKTDSCPNIAFE